MAKTYPVVLYPQKILKFLAQNPTPTQSNQSSRYRATNTPAKASLKRWYQWKYLLLLWLGVLIGLSLAFLSPFWLVVAAWVAILLGFLGILQIQKLTLKQPSSKQNNASLQVKLETETKLHSSIREHQLRSLLAGSVMKPQGKGSAPVGVSEPAFGEALRQIFPNIEQGWEFQNPELSTPYSVDFAVIHSSGLSIDIEVDEPYIGNTKQPHHCLDQDKDSIRNEFFTTVNWAVIRFSEKQVVQSPKSCCKVIASAIARITGDYTYLTQLAGVPDLHPDPMWTTRQAKKWAKENYRKTYLGRQW